MAIAALMLLLATSTTSGACFSTAAYAYPAETYPVMQLSGTGLYLGCPGCPGCPGEPPAVPGEPGCL